MMGRLIVSGAQRILGGEAVQFALPQADPSSLRSGQPQLYAADAARVFLDGEAQHFYLRPETALAAVEMGIASTFERELGGFQPRGGPETEFGPDLPGAR
jgi:hypothetical protein